MYNIFKKSNEQKQCNVKPHSFMQVKKKYKKRNL